MSELSNSHSSAEKKAHEIINRQASALAEAVAATQPENSAAGPLDIFPEPGERRADTEFTLPPEQEQAFREAMAKLGIGRETNLTAEDAGISSSGYCAIIEGGQAHKMAAELAVLFQGSVRPSHIIIAATPDRTIPPVGVDKVNEREVTSRTLGIDPEKVGKNEHEVARQVLKTLPEFIGHGDIEWPELYADPDSGPVKPEEKGKFLGIGNLHFDSDSRYGPGVSILRIDREYLEDGKSYKVLGSKGLMEFADRHLRATGVDIDIGFITSSTYQPSREIDAAAAMLGIERQGESRNIGVITYGTHELARVKKEQYPVPPALGQLAGEAHKAARQLEQLRDLLAAES